MDINRRIHDQLTEEFISDNPREISFTRHKKTKTSAGGFTLAPDALLLPQRGRLVHQRSDSANASSRTLPEGRVISVVGTLVFPTGADVEPHDTTIIDEMDYEVVDVERLPWSTEALVVGYAD